MDNEIYTAVVEKVIHDGKHGPYAVSSSEDIGLITFSLTSEVWKEVDFPERGNIVVLSLLRKKRAGWRANSGRFFRPSDQKQVNPVTNSTTERSKK